MTSREGKNPLSKRLTASLAQNPKHIALQYLNFKLHRCIGANCIAMQLPMQVVYNRIRA
jgi:hypothetical protein